MILEGGFQGRTNKLVDGCYSFWGGGDFPILSAALERRSQATEEKEKEYLDYLFDRGNGCDEEKQSKIEIEVAAVHGYGAHC